MTPTNSPPDPQTVPYATPAARRTPLWVWWLLGGLGAVVLLLLVLLVLGVLLYALRSNPRSATPATVAPPPATVSPAPATAPAGGTESTRIEDGG